jgi:hypothetical protein
MQSRNPAASGRYYEWGFPVGLAAVLLLLSASVVRATDNWIDGSDNWSVPGNWSSGVPGAGTDASISDTDGISRTVNYDYSGAPVALNSLTVDLTGGTSEATNTLSIPGNNLTTAGTEYIGYNGSGTVNQTAGVNTFNGMLSLGYNTGSTGIYNLSGTGAVIGSHNFIVGAEFGGNGIVNQSGGTVTMTNSAGESLVLGGSNGSGTYNLSGGLLSTTAEDVAAFSGSGGGPGTFIQTGGANNISLNGPNVALAIGNTSGFSGTYTLSGTGTLTTSSETIGPTGTFNQNGGSHSITGLSHQLAEFAIEKGTGSGGAFNLNGGTLRADVLTDGGSFGETGGLATFSQISIGGSASISGGTMALDVNGFSSPKSVILSSGNLSVTGTGVLNMQLGGYSQGVNYAWLRSLGVVSLGGTLDLDLAGGFVPNVRDQFMIMRVSSPGTITGAFNQLTSDDPGLTYSVNYGAPENMVQVTITSIPEPAALAGLLSGCVLVLRRRGRRTSAAMC